MTAAQTTRGKSSERAGIVRAFFALLLLLSVGTQGISAQAAPVTQTRLVVRDSLGLTGILNLCGLLGCSTEEALGDPQGRLFMIEVPSQITPLLSLLNISVLGLVSVETDQVVQTQGVSVALPNNCLLPKKSAVCPKSLSAELPHDSFQLRQNPRSHPE